MNIFVFEPQVHGAFFSCVTSQTMTPAVPFFLLLVLTLTSAAFPVFDEKEFLHHLSTLKRHGSICNNVFPACQQMAFGVDVTTFSPNQPNTGQSSLPVIAFFCDRGQGMDGYQLPDSFPNIIKSIHGTCYHVLVVMLSCVNFFLSVLFCVSRRRDSFHRFVDEDL